MYVHFKIEIVDFFRGKVCTPRYQLSRYKLGKQLTLVGMISSCSLMGCKGLSSASLPAENQFQDYQDLSTSGRGARCRAQSCYNNGKCIEKWLNPICECDMTSFTGPSCSDGKRQKIFKAYKLYI